MKLRIRLLATFLFAICLLAAGTSLHSQNKNPEPSLRQTVERFIRAADSGDTKTVAAIYDPTFTNIRVADDGGVVRLTREQVLQFLSRATATAFPTRDTTIQHIEEVGDYGFVLLTRTKKLGEDWEPMFYSLVWRKQGLDWRLLREFVHQRTMPKPR